MTRWIRHLVLAGGALCLLGPPGPLHAADGSLSVRPFAGVPPATIIDLSSTAVLVSGQVRLDWTAPTVFPGSSLDSYQIRIQTFPLSSVGGSTTTWWNTSGGMLVQGLYGESPGMIVTRTLGPPGSGSTHITGLSPGSTYYFAVRSADDVGLGFDFWSDVAQVIYARAYSPPPVSVATPKRPNGLTASAGGGQFTLNWSQVTQDTNHQPIGISQYAVYRYDAIESTPTLVGTVGAGTLSYTDTPPTAQTYFYRVVAVSAGSISSASSDYIDSTPQLNRYAIAPSDSNTRMTLPMSVAVELNAGSNGSGDDYEIVATRQMQNENSVTLKSYLFQVQNTRTGQVVPGFTFSQTVAEVQISYALAVPTIGLNAALIPGGGNSTSQAQAIAQVISLYWFNGSGFVRLGGTVLLQNQALMVSARNMGLYEVRAVSMPTSFALTRNSPYPRIINPNHPTQNNRVFWFFDNPTGDVVTGTIYDIRGAKVRDLAVDSLSPTANSIVWDGRDANGSVVPTGVYLYKIQAGKEKATGSVVVGR